jgi:hypothetical protein
VVEQENPRLSKEWQKIQFVVVYCTSQTIDFDEPFLVLIP